jgi:LPXTG-motif cell wall-anchored protein
MSKKTIIWAAIFSIIFFKVFTKDVFAVINVPNFPSCNNPHEFVKSHYDTGTHGIVGSNASYSGSDTVYSIGNDNHYQCFCAESGQGIQTNWWKASSLTADDEKILLNQGWHYVPDGSAWGLASGGYYAINNNYSCRSGQVAGTSFGQVLGLASTGSKSQIFALFGLSGLFAVTALILKKKST